jgi:UrcA family protein
MNHPLPSFVLGLCAAAAFAAPAIADPYFSIGQTYQVSRTVHLADVNLHTTDGASVAAWRIRRAADYVCGGDQLIVRASADFDSCRSGAVDRALAALNAPLVSAALGRPTPTDIAAR